MAYSTQRATSDGTMAYLDLSIQYMKRADINVFYNGLPANPATWSWVGTTDKRIAFSPLVANGVEVLVKRTTQINSIINVFANGAKFNNATMDQDFTQLLYLNQEAVEGAALTDIFNDVDFHGYKIKNLGVAVDDTDAITFGQVKTLSNGAYTSAQAAAASASDALGYKNLAQDWAIKGTTIDGSNYSSKYYAQQSATSASTASGAASAASGSAGTASSQAALAAGSATAAGTAKTEAEAARDAALGYRDDASDFADNSAASAAAAAASAGANIGQYNGIVRAYKNAGTAGFGWYDGSLVSPGAIRWAANSSSGPLLVNRYDSGGTIVDTPITVSDTTGVVTLADGLDLNSKKITGVATPTVGTDAVNKTYADTKALLGGNAAQIFAAAAALGLNDVVTLGQIRLTTATNAISIEIPCITSAGVKSTYVLSFGVLVSAAAATTTITLALPNNGGILACGGNYQNASGNVHGEVTVNSKGTTSFVVSVFHAVSGTAPALDSAGGATINYWCVGIK